jgi:hypothetical protein
VPDISTPFLGWTLFEAASTGFFEGEVFILMVLRVSATFELSLN